MERLPHFSGSRISISNDGAISPAPALKAFSTSPETTLTPRQVSEVCDAISYLLTALGMPPELRGFVIAVIGASNGCTDYFTLRDEDLANRLWPESDAKTESLQKRVKRLRDELTKWHQSHLITVLTYIQGDKINGKNLPTQYRVDCLPLLTTTLEIAPLSVNFDTHPADAIRKTAEDIAKAERFRLRAPAKMTRRRPARPRPEQFLKMIDAYAMKYVGGRLDYDTAFEEVHDRVDQLRERWRNPNSTQVVDSTTEGWVDKFVHPDPETDPKAAELDELFQWTPPDFVPHEILINNADKTEDIGRTATGEHQGLQEGSCDRTQLGLVRQDCLSVPVKEIDVVPGTREETAPAVILQPQSFPESSEFDEDFAKMVKHFAGMREKECDIPESELDGEEEPLEIDIRVSEALKAIDLFQSVGARLDLALLIDDETKTLERRELEGRDLAEDIPEWVAEAGTRRRSFIVRVRGPVIQVDDCDEQSREFLEPLAFLTFETSPQNYQAWIALDGNADLEATRRRLLLGLAQRGMIGNGGSYGALRWPGSINFKPERRGPAGSPVVRISSAQPGVKVTFGELASFGLLPDLPKPPALPTVESEPYQGPHKWPDYDKCLAAKPTPSHADAQFVWIALRRGFSESEIAAKLAEVSDVARKGRHAQRYIELTIREVKAWSGD